MLTWLTPVAIQSPVSPKSASWVRRAHVSLQPRYAYVCAASCVVYLPPCSALSRDVVGVCTEQNCLRQGCQGNRIFQDSNGRWYCVWPHHKSSRHRAAEGIGPVSLGSELEPLLRYYIPQGLKDLQGRYPQPDRRFLFIQKGSGNAFESDSFNYYFRAELVPKLEAQGKQPVIPLQSPPLYVSSPSKSRARCLPAPLD